MSMWRIGLAVLLVHNVIFTAMIVEADLDGLGSDLEDELTTESREAPVFLNQWAAHIPGGREVADLIARDKGYLNRGQIGMLKDHYLLEKNAHPLRSKRHAEHHTRSLREDERVLWAEQQRSMTRVKRDFLMDKRQEEQAYRNVRYTDEKWDKQWYLDPVRTRHTRATEITVKSIDEAYTGMDTTYNDPIWNTEWYLRPDGFDKRRDSSVRVDLCVVPCWYMGITGKGVTVTVIDDGLETTHPDLKDNYCPEASFDFNDHDADPTPRYDSSKSNKHGTRCAGEIGMIANNGICGVGVAYNAKIGGIRLLDGMVTDRLESEALCYAVNYTDIFSCSWGPSDDGRTMEGPGKLAVKCLELGITEGRDGKGVLYVWASGNGGNSGDDCNCDGYTSSIYTISISSASISQASPWYAEQCPSTMATTYSSGALGESKVVSTDIDSKCTNEHTGTSASAPLAAGIFALLLEAHPELTWRDVQHLVVWTAEYGPLCAVDGWMQNAAGFWVNSAFGFGLLSACNLVMAADKSVFKAVPEKNICEVASNDTEDSFPIHLETGHVIELSVETTGCKSQDNEVNYLEHVQIMFDIDYSKRGALEIWVVSPSGTNTTLLHRRQRDHSTSGLKSWLLMSVHTWGESPNGTWRIGIADPGGMGNNEGEIKKVTLILHGTKTQPWHVEHAGGKRKYDVDATQCKQYNTQNQNEEQ